MAKKTKAASLAIEEKLEQALVVPGYEPYKIPDNWCWTTIGSITNLYRGVSYKKGEGHSEKRINDCLIMRGGNIQEGSIDIECDNIYVSRELVSKEKYVKKYDVIIVASTGSTKVIGRAGISFADYDDIAFGAFLTLVRAIDGMYKPYISYYFQDNLYRNRVRQLASGVNINNIRNDYINETPIPLPPFKEQKRIVDRIESLFSKLDEAKEKAQEAIDNFETRKAAILHKAFSGELTAKWREENGVSIESWEEKQIKEISIPRAGYAFDSKKFSDSGYQIIRMGNLYNGILDLERNPVFIESEHINDSILTRSLIHSGDILITLTGTKYKRDYGYAVRIDEPSNLLVNQRILCLSPDTNCIVSDYLLYYLQSNQFRDVFFSCETGGVNQGNVSSKFVESIMIPIPQYSEQEEISNMISNLISKIQFAKESAETVIDQIDIMKKAILARAFRGELGTNDPEEESAVELLKEILSGNNNEEKAQKPKRTRIVIPKEIDSLLKTELERKIIKLFLKSETGEVSAEEIMAVSSKKFDILNTIRTLEKKHLIQKSINNRYTKYTLVR